MSIICAPLIMYYTSLPVCMLVHCVNTYRQGNSHHYDCTELLQVSDTRLAVAARTYRELCIRNVCPQRLYTGTGCRVLDRERGEYFYSLPDPSRRWLNCLTNMLQNLLCIWF